MRPGDHRGARRPLLRVLQRRREQLRLPDRRPRRLLRGAGRRPGDDERRLLLDALRALPAASELSRDAVPGRPVRLRGPGGRRCRLPRGEDRPAAVLAPRVHADAGGDEPAEPPGADQPRGPVQRPGLPEAAPGGAEPAGGPLRARAGQAGGDRARTLGAADRAPRHALRRPEVGDDPDLGPRPAPRAGAAPAAARRGRGLPARHRPAELLVGPDGRDAPAPGPLGLDGQRLDRLLRARPDRPPGRAERGPPRATSPRPSGRSRRRRSRRSAPGPARPPRSSPRG